MSGSSNNISSAWSRLADMMAHALFGPACKLGLASLFITFFAANAHAVPVTVEVNWPNWSSDNRVTVRDPSGTVLDTICDPNSCFNADVNTSHSETRTYDFPAGTNYSVFLEDAFGDGWNGTGAFVRILSDGVEVINDDGPPADTQTLNFDVTASGGGGPQLCYGRPYETMNFAGPVLISGTALQAGARYRYSNVTANTDAIVEITGLVNGASLNSFDTDTGLINTFQPEINTTGASAVDFRFDFIDSTTSAPVPFNFVGAAIDIDGNGGNLREYAEFDRSSDTYAINNPSLLDVDQSGPSSPTRRRFEARTSLTAPGIDPTADQNIVAAFYTNKTGFDYRIGTLGTTADTRLTSLEFDCPNFSNPVFPPDPSYDYGDAPSSFGNPRHTLVSGIRIGAINNADSTGYNDPTANADNSDDGITLPTFTQGQSATITANVTGVGGYLRGWVDWNGNGTFETTELVIDDVQSATGTITQSVTAPTNATTNQTFARFRWSTTQNMDATSNYNDGEVEDYSLTISGTPELQADKSVAIYDPANAGLYALPGNDVIYTITISNAGDGAADADSIELIDTLPSEVEFWNGDIDDGGPESFPVTLAQPVGSGMSLNYGNDIRFGTGASAPTNFAACSTIAPDNAYRPDLTYICFNPKGILAAGSPNPTIELSFRARIK